MSTKEGDELGEIPIAMFRTMRQEAPVVID